MRLAGFVLGYAFLIISIFLVGIFTQRLSDTYEDDPDAGVFTMQMRWYYWPQFALTILSIFASIVLIVGLHERTPILVFWWMIFHTLYTAFFLMVAIQCAFDDNDPHDVIYHFLYAAICIGVLIFMYLIYMELQSILKE